MEDTIRPDGAYYGPVGPFPTEAERDLADLLGAYSSLDHYQVIEYRLAETRRILANAAHAAAIAMALSPYGESA